MKNKTIEVRRGNATVKVNITKVVKAGVTYTSYVVNNYTGGQRKQCTFADPEKAKAEFAKTPDAYTGLVDAWAEQLGLRTLYPWEYRNGKL